VSRVCQAMAIAVVAAMSWRPSRPWRRSSAASAGQYVGPEAGAASILAGAERRLGRRWMRGAAGLAPPIGKQKRYPSLDLTVIHAVEPTVPKGRKRIEWKLLTDLPVSSCAEAVEKIRWYAMRWKIEVFHKILKSGCRAEDAKLRTADRLANLVSVFCIISWRVLWLTMLARTSPDAPPTVALTDAEIVLLDRLTGDAGNRKTQPGTLIFYLTKLARLGGYLARAADPRIPPVTPHRMGTDPPPGNTVVWRGLSRLTDIKLGAEIAGDQTVGN